MMFNGSIYYFIFADTAFLLGGVEHGSIPPTRMQRNMVEKGPPVTGMCIKAEDPI